MENFFFLIFKMNFGMSKVHYNFFYFYYSGFDDRWAVSTSFLCT